MTTVYNYQRDVKMSSLASLTRNRSLSFFLDMLL
jgi:hypothetical protein